MQIAVIGATTMIGQTLFQLMEEQNYPFSKIIPVTFEDHHTQTIIFKKQAVKTVSIETALDLKPTIAFFTGDAKMSSKWAEKFADLDCYVIDNSPVWRMEKNIKLIIPEINASILTKQDLIIASPNCTSIQMVMALAPLHQYYKIKRVIVSTYQAVSGAGQEAINQLEQENNLGLSTKVFPHEIYNNCIPHIDEFNVNGYTKDELRLMGEIKKILNDSSINVTATCVRVPISIGHSESINIEFENDFVLNKVKQLLEESEGIKVLDDPFENKYPMPVLIKQKNDVLVGRIRRDYSNQNSLNMWITANNLRRGAAYNSLKIAEHLVRKFINK